MSGMRAPSSEPWRAMNTRRARAWAATYGILLGALSSVALSLVTVLLLMPPAKLQFFFAEGIVAGGSGHSMEVVLLAAVWIAAQGVREILRPHSLPRPFTLVVLVVVVVVKELLFRYVARAGMSIESTAVTTDARAGKTRPQICCAGVRGRMSAANVWLR